MCVKPPPPKMPGSWNGVTNPQTKLPNKVPLLMFLLNQQKPVGPNSVPPGDRSFGSNRWPPGTLFQKGHPGSLARLTNCGIIYLRLPARQQVFTTSLTNRSLCVNNDMVEVTGVGKATVCRMERQLILVPPPLFVHTSPRAAGRRRDVKPRGTEANAEKSTPQIHGKWLNRT